MLITRLDCDLGDDVEDELCINETNILHYMGIIEERTDAILSTYYTCKTKIKQEEGKVPETKKPGNSSQNNQKQQKSSDPIAVNPPKVIDYSSDENSGDEVDTSRPLSIKELKAKTISRINQPRKKNDPVPLINRRRSSVLSRRRGSLLTTQTLSAKKSVLGTQCETMTSVLT